ncbi:hypothetical protein [Delftia sp. PS-11]|uniref:hypothetical protein n=1 Tax=Delftia sp. PS-11 TaxID=2767222 RepID=UPI0024674C7D|nr:hypothetical protein H9T68_22395 [Delftia sp. PS-11]
MKSILLFLLSTCISMTVLSAELTVIEISNARSHEIQYHLDGKLHSLIQIKDALSKKLTAAPDQKGMVRIAVLIDTDVKVGALSELRGLIMKIGFDTPRYFMTSKLNSNLSEININYSPVFHRSSLDAVMASD